MVTEVSRAPDGGWGWVVVLASFLLQALTVGITYTFGVVYVAFMEYFKDTESATAWIGSIQPALLYLTGVVGGPMLKRFGWRVVTISGACISAAGMWLSYLAPNIYVLYVTYGALTGIGFGMMYVTSMVTVQHYFDRRRTMATGMAVAGSGVGTLCFGFFIDHLLSVYHWRVTLLIEGALILVVGTCCGILFRPLPSGAEEEVDPLISEDKRRGVDTDQSPSCSGDGSSQRSTGATPESASTVHSSLSTPSNVHISPVTEASSSPPSWTHSVVKQLDHQGNPALPDIIEDTHWQLRDTYPSTFRDSCCPCCCEESLQRCDDKFKLSLCMNPRMVLYCLAVTFFCFGYHVPYVYTPARAIESFGLTEEKASFLVSTMGISNVVFRLFIGWLGDKSAKFRFYLMGSIMLLCGLDSIVSFLYTSFPLLLVYSALFGAFSGCFGSLFPVVMVDIMGLNVIEFSLGLVMASSSLAFLIASPAAGWVIGHFGGYNTAYCIVGAIQVVACIVFMCIKCVPERYRPLHLDKPLPRRIRYYSESFA